MVWKCPRCSRKSTSYQVMMKHFYSKHHKSKAGSTTKSKGKQNKTYVFKPPRRK